MKKIRSIFLQISSGKKPDFVIWCFPVIGLLILCLIPFLLKENGFESFDKATIAGPVIAFIAALLTFLAFWAQIQANKINSTEIKNENIDAPGFIENRFYELLKIHRSNVAEININHKIFNRKAFISMFCEFKCCYLVLKNVYSEQHEIRSGKSILSEQDMMNISYVVFFMGINRASGDLMKDLIKQYEQPIIEKYIACLKRLQKRHSEEGQIAIPENGILFSLRLKYKPFCGHMQTLENYYRHLFQTVKFVVDQDESSEKEKYELLRVLRAQLSGHEQLMLYYNSLTTLGKPWIENKYFTEYRMIKNIPLPLADFGEKPKDKLGEKNSKGELLFEWDEMSFRNKIFNPEKYNGQKINGKTEYNLK